MALPIVDVCFVSATPGAGYVMAREDGAPLADARRFPITTMIDEFGDDTTDPDEARAIVFGSDYFGWCTYELDDLEPETVQ